ncbi:glycosyltransferase family 2 protein [Bermanella sp. WJH001]|uniref:glycosyltransferase n=1 Tax=Bermanella sp. WJH001 TaxID=3048005 RepID=UPI0024BF0D53|nr:glycosyltransferase family 2 protein [Bermanella sp. WJH001]MDJ1537332.1 glycosyltransferase family 2 protein [Bermanella sp. WJH001]
MSGYYPDLNNGTQIDCSIVMPCFNVEGYIGRAIESVLQQSFTNFELLVVIDGSPDKSQQIAEAYAARDNRVKVFLKNNGGVSSARNYGLKKATGKYVYFIDPDDWIKPNLLKENIELLERCDSDLVVFGILNTYAGVVESMLKLESQTVSKGQSFELQRDVIKAFGYSWNKIYKRQIIDREQIAFDESLVLWEDCVFNFTYLQKIESYTLNKECYYHYNIYEGSASHKSYTDYKNYINAYEKSAIGFINVFEPRNKMQSIGYVYSLFLDVLYSELIKSKNTLFQHQFDYYFNKVRLLRFSGLSLKKVVIYHLVRYKLVFLLNIYRSIRR